MSYWYMINTFVLNLGTVTVLIFIICKLTYCIEFTENNFFSFFNQWLFFLNNLVVLAACVIAIASIIVGLRVSRSYLDIYRIYLNHLFYFIFK